MRLLRLRRCPARHGVAVRVGAVGVRDPVALTSKGGGRADEQSACCEHCGELLHVFTPFLFAKCVPSLSQYPNHATPVLPIPQRLRICCPDRPSRALRHSPVGGEARRTRRRVSFSTAALKVCTREMHGARGILRGRCRRRTWTSSAASTRVGRPDPPQRSRTCCTPISSGSTQATPLNPERERASRPLPPLSRGSTKPSETSGWTSSGSSMPATASSW